MRPIPIGQYVYLNTIIHRLDPRTKLSGIILLAVLVLTLRDYPGIFLLSIFLVFVILLSKLPASLILRGLKGFLSIFLFTILVHTFFTAERQILSGLYRGVFITLQLALLIAGGLVLTWTTSPFALVGGLRCLFTPARLIGLPVDRLSLIMVIALRFIPTLILEADRLIRAQSCRGIRFREGPIRMRVRNLISILAPLLVNALRRADDLALTMEARCFDPDRKRTSLHELCFKRRDLLAFLVLALLTFSTLRFH